jgi:hypothetical protein
VLSTPPESAALGHGAGTLCNMIRICCAANAVGLPAAYRDRPCVYLGGGSKLQALCQQREVLTRSLPRATCVILSMCVCVVRATRTLLLAVPVWPSLRLGPWRL